MTNHVTIPPADIRDEKALRHMAGRAIHRPTDLNARELVALASAVIVFLDKADTMSNAESDI